MAKSLLRTDNEIAEMYARHAETVFRVCFTYMKNVTDAEDAAADTFVNMIKKKPAFESIEHEKAWLIRTAINICKDALKHWWRKRESLHNYADTLKAETSFEIDETAQAVLALPGKYKDVVYLYYFEGYTSVQIARLLNKPQSTIRNHLREARAILKERLGESYENQ